MAEIRTETQVPRREDLPDGPLHPDQAIPTALMFLIACLGGAMAFYRKVRENSARPFNLVELVGELFISGVSGVFAYWVFRGFHLDPYLTAAGVGIIGHMGSRAFFLAERFLEGYLDRAKDKL